MLHKSGYRGAKIAWPHWLVGDLNPILGHLEKFLGSFTIGVKKMLHSMEKSVSEGMIIQRGMKFRDFPQIPLECTN